MAEITQLRGSDHDRTQRLLPWYNNGTLEPDEQALVEAHLAQCAECRADAEADAALAFDISALDLEALPAARESERPKSSVSILRRRVPFTWMLAGQAAAALLVVGIFTAIPSNPPDQTYHALGSAPAAQPGNIVIVFKADTSEERMRSALLATGAQVVDGPNVSGAYVLLVPRQAREIALKQLRGMPQVMLAEPIGPGPAS